MLRAGETPGSDGPYKFYYIYGNNSYEMILNRVT